MENETIPFIVAKRLATSAGCRDPQWLYSFLIHATSEEDARRSIDALRRNCAEKFQVRSRTIAVDVPPARETGNASRGRNNRRAYA
jgi:hypothetical protein